MTIGAWVTFILFTIVIFVIGIVIAVAADDKAWSPISIIISVILTVALFTGMRWYYNSTGSGQRAMIDQKSNISGGIERVVNVYTANGDKIATYEGKIDLDTNDGGYVKFDFNGKRYIYYNCFVETIATIN